jgi:hypothetical protein
VGRKKKIPGWISICLSERAQLEKEDESGPCPTRKWALAVKLHHRLTILLKNSP